MDPMEEDHGLEMGQRPSRRRRHLPLAATHSISERPAERKKVSTLKPSSSPMQAQGLRHRKTSQVLQEKQKKKEARQSTTKVSRKVVLGAICVIWSIFIVYRVYLCVSQGKVGHLSIVHFLSSLVPL
jgi:hypothetical protein